MSKNEFTQITNTERVFTFNEAIEFDKYLNSKPTIKQPCWTDVKTGGIAAFISV